MMTYKNKNVLVIGNGFDLNIGLRTRYSDFIENHEWLSMLDTQYKLTGNHLLLQHLERQSKESQWFDIEAALLQYAIKKELRTNANTAIDEQDYLAVCKALQSYIKSIIPCQLDYDCWAKKLMRYWKISNNTSPIYSFNYTPFVRIMNELTGTFFKEPIYLHGNINDGIILGIESTITGKVPHEYSFLFKLNHNNYSPSNFYLDIENSQEVIVFGHSINNIDMFYFKDYLEEVATYPNNRKLTIITKDENSKICIKNNIRSINASIIHNLLDNNILDFILTDSKNEKEKKKFEELLRRL